jgi:hypothetical protein
MPNRLNRIGVKIDHGDFSHSLMASASIFWLCPRAPPWLWSAVTGWSKLGSPVEVIGATRKSQPAGSIRGAHADLTGVRLLGSCTLDPPRRENDPSDAIQNWRR